MLCTRVFYHYFCFHMNEIVNTVRHIYYTNKNHKFLFHILNPKSNQPKTKIVQSQNNQSQILKYGSGFLLINVLKHTISSQFIKIKLVFHKIAGQKLQCSFSSGSGGIQKLEDGNEGAILRPPITEDKEVRLVKVPESRREGAWKPIGSVSPLSWQVQLPYA